MCYNKEIKLNGQITDAFTYNATGAVVTHNDKTYYYDEWDRMSGYSDGTDTYAYKYDANGIGTQKNDKQYIIDINNNVVILEKSDEWIKELETKEECVEKFMALAHIYYMREIYVGNEVQYIFI